MHTRKAFTLIELLVVIGLIAVLAGVLGLALGSGNSGAALQSSQATLQGLFAAARGQAAINQKDATVIVNTNPDNDGFLREFHIIVDGRAVSSPVTLSQGIHLVPPVGASISGITFAQEGDWSNRRSSAFAGNATTPVPVGVEGNNFRNVLTVTNRGIPRLSNDESNQLIIAPAERQDAITRTFNNADAVRGVAISRYGVLTFLNDAESLPNP